MLLKLRQPEQLKDHTLALLKEQHALLNNRIAHLHKAVQDIPTLQQRLILISQDKSKVDQGFRQQASLIKDNKALLQNEVQNLRLSFRQKSLQSKDLDVELQSLRRGIEQKNIQLQAIAIQTKQLSDDKLQLQRQNQALVKNLQAVRAKRNQQLQDLQSKEAFLDELTVKLNQQAQNDHTLTAQLNTSTAQINQTCVLSNMLKERISGLYYDIRGSESIHEAESLILKQLSKQVNDITLSIQKSKSQAHRFSGIANIQLQTAKQLDYQIRKGQNSVKVTSLPELHQINRIALGGQFDLCS